MNFKLWVEEDKFGPGASISNLPRRTGQGLGGAAYIAADQAAETPQEGMTYLNWLGRILKQYERYTAVVIRSMGADQERISNDDHFYHEIANWNELWQAIEELSPLCELLKTLDPKRKDEIISRFKEAGRHLYFLDKESQPDNKNLGNYKKVVDFVKTAFSRMTKIWEQSNRRLSYPRNSFGDDVRKYKNYNPFSPNS